MASTISSAGGVKKWSLRSHSVSLASNLAANARCTSAGTSESRKPITASMPFVQLAFIFSIIERVRTEVARGALVLIPQVVVVPRHEDDAAQNVALGET